MLNIYSGVICGGVLPWVSVATRSNFWPLYKEILRRHTGAWSERPTGEVGEKLRTLLVHAYDSVSFYRQRMDTLGLKPHAWRTLEDFRQLPPTTKADLAANFPDGLLSSKREHGPWRYVSSSGTVDRVSVIQDFRKREFVRATQLLALRTAAYRPGMKYLEIPPDVCANVCGVGGTQEPTVFQYAFNALTSGAILQDDVRSNLRGLVERQLVYRRLELPSFAAGGIAQPHAALDEYLNAIDTYHPHVVKALPIYLYLLALRIEDGGIKPRIRGALMPMGSSMTPHMKRVIERAFGRRVHEDYGCAEVGGMAAECGHQNGLHPFRDLFFIEILRDGRPASEGELGKVLITDLCNFAMPLIRYEVGDVAVCRRGRCACGVSTDRFEVQGRVQDCLLADDGSILTSDTVIDAVLAEHPGVLGFQMDQRQDGKLHVRVVPRAGRALHLDGVTASIAQLVGRSRPIVARRAGTIVPERSGKYRFVRNLAGPPLQALQ